MDFRRSFCIITCFICANAFTTSQRKTVSSKDVRSQRRNSRFLDTFPDPRRPLKDFNRLDKFLRKQMNLNKTDDVDEIPDEMETKIINGRQAEPAEFPWMVALHRSGRFICSAFLVSPIYVMTAAHCVEFENGVEPASNFYGILGTIDRNVDSEENRVEFSEITAHPDFGKGESEGDVALMRITEPVTVSESLQPICLPEGGRDFELEYVQSMGWGITSNEADDGAENLQHTELAAQPRSLCQLFFGFMLISITDRHICAAANTATGVCFGDSGGPLVLNDMQSGRPLAIGVASFVTFLGCGRPLIPGVYTATAAYADWARQTAGPDSGLCFV